MKKTFYSVTYAVWGSSFCREAWFDSKADSIRAAEERVAATAAELIA